MEEACKICGETQVSERHFSSKHKINQKEYYTKYYPRFDLYTHEPIVFKDKDHYFNAFFNSKLNMVNWLRTAPKNEAKKFVLERLQNRAKTKNLKFAPSHLELRSIESLPNMIVINKTVGDYYDILNDIPSLKNRFTHKRIAHLSREEVKEIAVDTREQKPLSFDCDTVVTKLDYGDYTCLNNFQNIFIDRKSPTDFINTFTMGFERFCAELERAAQFSAYVVILVESSFERMYTFDKSYIGKFTKSSPQRVFHNLREILQRYDNVQALFVENRSAAAKYVKKIFELGKEARFVDLQYMHDGNIF